MLLDVNVLVALAWDSHVHHVAARRWFLAEAVRCDPCLALGVNTHAGHVTHRAVAETFDLPYAPIAELL